MAIDDIDLEDLFDGGGAQLKTSLPGIQVTTSLDETDVEELEAVHRRQLEYALERAEDAKEATRM
jgi:hypothetical protein